VAQPARGVDAEEPHLRPAPPVAVADDDHHVAGDQHLVVPGVFRVDSRPVRVHRRDGPQVARAHPHGEETPAAQDDQVLAVHLHDSALVHPGVLHVGDGDARRPRGEHFRQVPRLAGAEAEADPGRVAGRQRQGTPRPREAQARRGYDDRGAQPLPRHLHPELPIRRGGGGVGRALHPDQHRGERLAGAVDHAAPDHRGWGRRIVRGERGRGAGDGVGPRARTAERRDAVLDRGHAVAAHRHAPLPLRLVLGQEARQLGVRAERGKGGALRGTGPLGVGAGRDGERREEKDEESFHRTDRERGMGRSCSASPGGRASPPRFAHGLSLTTQIGMDSHPSIRTGGGGDGPIAHRIPRRTRIPARIAHRLSETRSGSAEMLIRRS